MRAFVIAFLISFFCCAFVHSIELKCNSFGTADWPVIGSKYYCEIVNQEIITDKFNRVVHSVTGNHTNSKSNDDVKAINIYNSIVNFFPRGVEKYFKNLQGIQIGNSNLKEIRKSDLKPFAELRVLSLYQNQLEVIEANLFDNNPKLEGIYLWENRISHVDAKALNKFVGKLRYLQFTNNICQLGNSHDDIQDSNEIIEQIQYGVCEDENKLKAFYMNSVDGLWEAMNQIVENSMKNLGNTLVSKIEGIDSNLKAQIERSLTKIEQNVEKLQKDQMKAIEDDRNEFSEIKTLLTNLENRVRNIETTTEVNPAHLNNP